MRASRRVLKRLARAFLKPVQNRSGDRLVSPPTVSCRVAHALLAERAASSTLFVAITFAYREERLRYLFEVIRSLAAFPVRFMSICVVTNTVDATSLDKIRNLARLVLDDSKDMRLASFPDLAHPFDLTWCHKAILREAFMSEVPHFDYFVYLEDDLAFRYENFLYFIEYNETLKPHRLIPSFIRFEYCYRDNTIYSSDIFDRFCVDKRSHVTVGRYRFINCDYPYTGMFVMDRGHFAEYLQTRSFDKEASKEVHVWYIPERSAMGLTWEAVPEGYFCRYVIPLDLSNQLPLPACYIHHLPGNYANRDQRDDPLGSVPMAQAFYLSGDEASG